MDTCSEWRIVKRNNSECIIIMDNEKALRGFTMVLIRMIGALVTSFIISLLVVWIGNSSLNQSETNPDSTSFIVELLVFFIPITFVFLVIAVPYSLFVDRWMKGLQWSRLNRERFAALLYIAGGAISLLTISLLMSHYIQTDSMKWMLVLGGLMSLTYFIVVRILEFIFRMIKRG